MMRYCGMPNTSSRSSMPGDRRDSASKRSLVALSSSKMRVERFGIISQAVQYRDAAVGILRRNQAMRVPLIDEGGGKHSRSQVWRQPPRLSGRAKLDELVFLRFIFRRGGIEQPPHADHSGDATAHQQLERRRIVEHGIRIRPRRPLIREPRVEENVQRFEDSDQQRNAREFILREQPACASSSIQSSVRLTCRRASAMASSLRSSHFSTIAKNAAIAAGVSRARVPGSARSGTFLRSKPRSGMLREHS